MGLDREALRARLHGFGFDVVRFAAVAGDAPGSDALDDWLEAGRHADMAWIERGAAKRRDPRQVLDGARTMIMLGVNYGGDLPSRDDGQSTGVWARYALNNDYHDTVKPGLVAAGRAIESWAGVTSRDYRYYVDTGPVLERSWATRAGVGFTGKNAMLISREFGNWLFLAAIMTRVEIAPDAPVSARVEAEPVGTLCGNCTRCLDACPTNALPEPGVLDARRCISYQTIENKGIIPRELRTGIGDRIYGCDICAEVCPWNRFAQTARSGLLEARPELAQFSLSEILRLTPEGFAVGFKGTAVKRLKLRGLLRNACIVAANTGARECGPALVDLTRHAEAMVRAHAVWALRVLQTDAPWASLRAMEVDPLVLAEYDAPLEPRSAQA
ncbi:tRNA epoxyqueuosine(34) reductase QueG [Synoicihabitans lomoniglobus]|uniref:tRNA epoxyqueuosine(34) reductase QueG n=1 Tax=Synoicihabitans lomoniglobus TaxID=2909285 RepID=A0AAF0CST8_9BACT|nr:tRNA epoxyqueuosine(34) reductase QueG [Opitutaceae bacterium LMO-M01]WED67427.1 tRNA epoxyqueuosine(34) reductase QueG [Opitutaceae bacterium LMO-M01]